MMLRFGKYRPLSKGQLQKLFELGRAFNREKRLSTPNLSPSLTLHDAHHAFAEKLASSGTKPFAKYRFAPVTPQLVKKYKTLYDLDQEELPAIHTFLGEENFRLASKNQTVENFVAGLEGIKPGQPSVDNLESRDYWLGRRVRKKMLPKEYKQALKMMVKDTEERRLYSDKSENPFDSVVTAAFEESKKVSLPSPPSIGWFYRTSTKGKKHRVRRGK